MEELGTIYDGLKYIRTYLIKKGKDRYKGNTIKLKYQETLELKNTFHLLKENLGEIVKNLSTPDLEIVNKYILKIQELFSEIENLCRIPEVENSSFITMEKFCLKTAVSLLPTIDGSESSIIQLIDSVEMYATLIDGSGQQLLINFVLKTRLNESAKLRMAKSYGSVCALVNDL